MLKSTNSDQKQDSSGNWTGCDCFEPWFAPFYSATEHNWTDITDTIAALPETITTCNPATGKK